ncbi:MAG: preprotein translocase subunit YajC [Bacteroidetes bacterium]|nr:preprotein translocase subunit YajC [Bacteroidota bacterium]MCH8030241.1 preprotein translocase subunit YajC [Bacteroidota bacterium]
MIASTLILAQSAPGFDPSFFIMMGLIFVVFYFFIIRPQRKREADRKQMIAAVQKGDKIITAGGVHATVTKVEETSVLAQVDDNVKLRFEKSAISSVPSRTSDGK